MRRVFFLCRQALICVRLVSERRLVSSAEDYLPYIPGRKLVSEEAVLSFRMMGL